MLNKLLYSTVRLVANGGGREGSASMGTGFLVADGDMAFPVLVTNVHVIRGCDSAVVVFCRANPDGSPSDSAHVRARIDNLQGRAIPHPDESVDLCAIRIDDLFEGDSSGPKVRGAYLAFIGTDMFVTDELIEGATAIEDLIMIGYPKGLMDEANNKPVVRKGITATHIALDFEGRKEFMADIAVFNGSSGSPVFLERTGLSERQIENGISIGIAKEVFFAGVIHSMPVFSEVGEVITVEVPTAVRTVSVHRQCLNLGHVIKAERVRELLSVVKDENGLSDAPALRR